jgi:hypothetical protein
MSGVQVICNAMKENLCKNKGPLCSHAVPHLSSECIRLDASNDCIFSNYKIHECFPITVGTAFCVECEDILLTDYMKRIGI